MPACIPRRTEGYTLPYSHSPGVHMSVLAAGRQGTPLLILESALYAAWLEQQPASTRNWLQACGFSGKGLQLLPDTEGKLQRGLFVCKSLDDAFACGDLATSLPAGDYWLENIDDPEQMTRIAFAWGVSCYRFERYRCDDKPLPCLYISDENALRDAQHLVIATRWVRVLVNTPAADIIASELVVHLRQAVVNVVLTETTEIINEGVEPTVSAPQLFAFSWGVPSRTKVILAGKEDCFDRSGLAIRPAEAIRAMKKV